MLLSDERKLLESGASGITAGVLEVLTKMESVLCTLGLTADRLDL